MPLTPGSTLGSYRIVAPLGAGGMGEVYRAEDSRLRREVAIKVLPGLLAKDAEGMARFEREARLLAALNHPNIAAIHGLEEAGGATCLVLELVEGVTLARRLQDGPLPADEALAIALQVATALEAAHEKGIVHRDLKPSNVMVTPAGDVKVLDFGLAKAMEEDRPAGEPAASLSPTITMAATRMGVILGTAAYMSPEQAKGKPVDRRADIWAFGVLLFEMLSGRQLFGGETPSETLASVMMTPVAFDRLPAATPPAIRRLLLRCLERDPRRRLREIGEARIVLEDQIAGRMEAAPAPAAAAAPAASRALSWARAAAWMATGLAIGAALAGLGLRALRAPAPPGRVQRFEIPVQGSESTPPMPRISPDGSAIAWLGENAIFVRELDKLEPRVIRTPSTPDFVGWSPDSRWLVYAAAAMLYKMPASGGESVALSRLSGGSVGGRGITWGEGGRIVFSYGSSGLFEISDRGGDPRELAAIDPNVEQDFHEPSFLPGSRGILLVRHPVNSEADTIAVARDGKTETVFRIPGQRLEYPTWSSSGHILFHRVSVNPGVWALPFSLSTLKVTGEPFLVQARGRELSVSSEGTLVITELGDSGTQQMVWVDRAGKVLGKVGEPRPAIGEPRLSHDALRVAAMSVENDVHDLWIHDVKRGTRTRLTFEGQVFAPFWAPDDRILYDVGTPGVAEAKMKQADGTGETVSLGVALRPCVSADGKYLVYGLYDHQTNMDLWYRPMAGGEPVAFLRTPAREEKPALSPDGAWLAYVSAESGRSEVYLKRFPSGEGKWQVSAAGGDMPVWSGKGDELFFRADDTEGPGLWAADVRTRPSLILGSPHRLFSERPSALVLGGGRRWDPAPDGQRFLAVQNVGGAGPTASITVVQNWYAEFAARQ